VVLAARFIDKPPWTIRKNPSMVSGQGLERKKGKYWRTEAGIDRGDGNSCAKSL